MILLVSLSKELLGHSLFTVHPLILSPGLFVYLVLFHHVHDHLAAGGPCLSLDMLWDWILSLLKVYLLIVLCQTLINNFVRRGD